MVVSNILQPRMSHNFVDSMASQSVVSVAHKSTDHAQQKINTA